MVSPLGHEPSSSAKRMQGACKSNIAIFGPAKGLTENAQRECMVAIGRFSGKPCCQNTVKTLGSILVALPTGTGHSGPSPRILAGDSRRLAWCSDAPETEMSVDAVRGGQRAVLVVRTDATAWGSGP